MQERIYIHVGYPRAGSSHIKREYLKRFADELIVPRGNALKQFYGSLVAKENNRINEISFKSDSVDVCNVLSSESLCGMSFWNADGVTNVAQNLKIYYPNSKILLIIREQEKIIQSAYLYSVKKGQYLSRYDKFVERNKQGLLGKYCYDKIVKIFDNEFGEENVCVVPFEELESNLDKFRDRLSEYFDSTQVNWDVLSTYTNTSKNASLDIEVQRLLNLLLWPVIRLEKKVRKSRYVGNKLRQAIDQKTLYERFCRHLANKSLILICASNQSYTLPKEMLDEFRRSNDKLKQLRKIELENYGYRLTEELFG